MINRYEIYLDENDWMTGFCHTADPERDLYEFDGAEVIQHEINAYHVVAGKVVLDTVREAEIIEERRRKEEEEARKPTWQESIESQVVYTALMTDTLLEEE